ncbi:hypothetical protein VP758_000870 [Vibrio harveyi]|nr:hypothetical protein [Vibrio harveyi]
MTNEQQKIRLAFGNVQHMRITLHLSRQRLAEHIVTDDVLQTHLDSHVALVEAAYQHLLDVVTSQNNQPSRKVCLLST